MTRYVLVTALVALAPSCAPTTPTTPPGARRDASDRAWRDLLSFVPPDAPSVAGWDLTEFDDEVDAGAYPQLPWHFRDDDWEACRGLRGSSDRLVRWSRPSFVGHALAGTGVGREDHVRCALGGRPDDWRIVDAATGGTVFVSASGEPEAFAPSDDLLVVAYFDDRFTSRTNAEKITQITERHAHSGTGLSERLRDVDLRDVTWSISQDEVEPRGRQLGHHRTSESRTFRSGTRVVGRATFHFSTPEIAGLYAERLKRTLRLFRRWEEDAPPPRLIGMVRHAAVASQRLDTTRIRVSVAERSVVVRASVAHGQRAALERVIFIPASTTLDATTPEAVDREIRSAIESYFGEHHCGGRAG